MGQSQRPEMWREDIPPEPDIWTDGYPSDMEVIFYLAFGALWKAVWEACPDMKFIMLKTRRRTPEDDL